MIEALLGGIAGAVLAAVLSCVPGLHIYSVMGALALLLHAVGGAAVLPGALLPAVAIGLVAGYSVVSILPSILLAAPDDSALFTVLPGQKLLMKGRGEEAVVLTGIGCLAGLLMVGAVLAPAAPTLLPPVARVLSPHWHWILWCVIAFMLLSEWPKTVFSGGGALRRLLDGWRSLGAGLFTFFLSGIFGFILFYRSPISVDAGFQNLMPAFTGLFTLPWLLLNLVSRAAIPAQERCAAGAPGAAAVLRGAAAGGLGGGFAAFFPVVTGGVGAFLAGHATAQRDDRQFLIAQGASRFVYYAGGLLLLFVPGLHLTRGGAAWMLRGLWNPRGSDVFYGPAVAALFAGSLVALALLRPLARLVLFLLARAGYRHATAASAIAIITLVAAVTGWAGLGVMAVGAAIGLIPPLYGSRRMNCLGVILLPMACNMSGVGGAVAEWLRLM